MAENCGLPRMLMPATLRPAVNALEKPPNLPRPARGQPLYFNAHILLGVELCTNLWKLILEKPAQRTSLDPVLLSALGADSALLHPIGGTGIPLTILRAYTGDLFVAVASYAVGIHVLVAFPIPLYHELWVLNNHLQALGPQQ